MLKIIHEEATHHVPSIGSSISCRCLKKVANDNVRLNCDAFAVMTSLFQVNLQCITRHLC